MFKHEDNVNWITVYSAFYLVKVIICFKLVKLLNIYKFDFTDVNEDDNRSLLDYFALLDTSLKESFKQ